MKRLTVILILILIAAGRPALADCLVVSGQQFEMQTAEVGGLAVEWKARIDNECNAAFDADLTVLFLDSDGESVYETRDWAKLERGESRDIGKRIYIPSAYDEAIAGIEVQVKERERPL
jgi:hypothetical protein